LAPKTKRPRGWRGLKCERPARCGPLKGLDVNLFLAALLKPFVALVILVPALMLADWINRKLPDSRLKRILFRPLPGHAQRGRWGGGRK